MTREIISNKYQHKKSVMQKRLNNYYAAAHDSRLTACAISPQHFYYFKKIIKFQNVLLTFTTQANQNIKKYMQKFQIAYLQSLFYMI